MPEDTASVKLEVKDRQVMENLKEVISSLGGFRIINSHGPQGPDNNLYCDLLILEVGEDIKKEIKLVQSIQKTDRAGEVFLTSSRTEPDVLLGALRTGAKEFFPQPINKEEVRSSLIKFKERKAEAAQGKGKEKKGKIISVMGSKGGVGTTTIAVNLAASLASTSAKVNGKKSFSLMDMNLLFGEIPLFMDIKSSLNWGEITKDISRLDSTYLMSVLSKHPSGVYVLPAPGRIDGMQTATPDNIEILVTQMRDTFDFIVIDNGHALNNISLKILELSDIILIVSVLSLPCLINIRKLMEIFQILDYPDENNIKVIVNRYQKKSLISIEEAEKSINRKFFWVIPNDYQNTMIAINEGKTLESLAYKNAVAENFKQFASAFLQKKGKETEKSSILGNLFGRKIGKIADQRI
jgi:pilus assembly protein CpaE